MSDDSGVGWVKRMLAAHIQTNFPPYLATWRTARGFEEEDVPDPALVSHNDVSALDRWPTIAVSGVRRTAISREQYRDGNIEYESAYAIRVFLWVRSEQEGATIDMRDRFTTALATFLVDRQVIDADQNMYVDEGTLIEEYSDTSSVKGERFVSGAFIACNVVVDEVITRPPSGTVASTNVDVLVTHPALEDLP